MLVFVSSFEAFVFAVAEKVEKSLLNEDNIGFWLVRSYYERLSSRKEESLQMIFNSFI